MWKCCIPSKAPVAPADAPRAGSAAAESPATQRLLALSELRVNQPAPCSVTKRDGSKLDVLLVLKPDSSLRVVANRCPHYGLPLTKGIVTDDCISCPFHGARMNMTTGDIEDGPAFDKLLVFPPPSVGEDGVVCVTVPEHILASDAKAPSPAPVKHPVAASTPGVVIAGAGVASLAAIDELRRRGFEGPITVFGREKTADWHHYDRTKLSKNIAGVSTPAAVAIRPPEWWAMQRVTLRSAEPIARVVPGESCVELASGEKVLYWRLLLATGASAKTIAVSGPSAGGGADADASAVAKASPSSSSSSSSSPPAPETNASKQRVFVCHDPHDAAAIVAAVREVGSAARIVVVGAGFVGMEVAASLAGTFSLATDGDAEVGSVTVLCSKDEPLEPVIGRALGRALRRVAEKNGIIVRTACRAAGVRCGASGSVEAVELRGGEEVGADVVIVAIGTAANTALVEGCEGVTSDPTGIHADECLRAGPPGVYVAGDVASLPGEGHTRRPSEHWNGAIAQGRLAARNMLSTDDEPFSFVPLFSSGQSGKNLRLAGHTSGWDDVFTVGSLEEPKATAFFGSGDKVIAVATIQDDPNAVAARELLRTGRMPSFSSVRDDGGVDLVRLAQEA